MPILFVQKLCEALAVQNILSFLACWDEVQEELLYCPGVGLGVGIGSGVGGVGKMFKFLRGSFLCDGQGAVRPAILSL